jgi:hypothetical protein
MLLLGLACTEKEAAFFGINGSSQSFGEIIARVIGAQTGTNVTVSGNGINRTQLVTSAPYAFLNLPYGSYSVAAEFPAGQICTPDPASVILGAANPAQSVQFDCTDLLGSLAFDVSGLDVGITFPYALSGAASRSGNLAFGETVISGLPAGDYDWSVTAPLTWSCSPLTGSFSLSAGARYDETIACAPETGTIVFSSSGLTGGTTFPLTLSGPTDLSGQIGANPLTFTAAPAGDWSFQLGSTPGFTCAPGSGTFALSAAATYTQQIDCTVQTGSITATVTGATATVSYAGPSSGSASVGAAGVTFSDLAAGTYDVAVANPAGYTCTPPTIQVVLPAGGTGTADFTCQPVMAVTYTLDATMLYDPGIVTGARTGNLLQAGSPVGTYQATPSGPSNNYFGWTPYRWGMDAGNAWTFGSFNVGGSGYSLNQLQFCATTAFGGVNLLGVTYLDDLNQAVGTAQLPTGPGCFSGNAPAGTSGFRIEGVGSGSFDFNSVVIAGVSW